MLEAKQPPVLPVSFPYEVFLDFGEEPPDFLIRVRDDPSPPLSEGEIVSELEGSWRLWEKDGVHRLEILEKVGYKPRLVVRFSSDWKGVDMWITRPLVSTSPFGALWCVGEALEPLGMWWLVSAVPSKKQVLVCHGSAVVWKETGLAFIGPSGSGKSTMADLWSKAGGALILNDERILIWPEDSGWRVSGTPWPGMIQEVSSDRAWLKHLFFLRRRGPNGLSQLSALDAFERFTQEMFCPFWSVSKMEDKLGMAGGLLQEVPSGDLSFVKDNSAIRYLENLLCSSDRAEALEAL